VKKPLLFRSKFLTLLVMEWLWLAFLLPVLCIWLSTTNSIKIIDNFVYDRLLSQHVQAVDSNIVLIDIDERSLSQIGAWPWPRTTHAQFLSQLNKAQPKSVLFDVIFAEPDAQPNSDKALSDAIAQSANVSLPVLLLPKGDLSINENTEFKEIPPTPVLAKNARLGHIMAQPDADNVLRSIHLYLRADQVDYPALALQAAQLNSNNPQKFQIPFIAPAGSYAHVSYVDVLNGNVPTDVFKNRYVLIGARAAGLGDQYSTPFGTMNGVEIQASVLDALLNQRSIQVLEAPVGWVLMALPILLLLLGFVSLNERYHLLLLLSVAMLHIIAVAGGLWWLGIWLPPVSTWLCLLLAYLLWSWRRLSAAVRYFDDEIQLIAQSPTQLRALLMHLSPSTALSDVNVTQRRSLTTLIQQVGDLQHFITHSLLQAQPVAMLVFSQKGDIILSNQKAQSMMGQRSFEGLSIQQFFSGIEPISEQWPEWHTKEGYAWLNGHEVSNQMSPNSVYQAQVTPVQMEGVGQTWLLGFIDLTLEREIQRQNRELIQFLSHDLRTPLVNIISLLQLHKYDSSQMGKDDMMSQVEQNVHRTLTLAENLVFLAHAKTGAYRYIELNLAQIVPLAIEQVWAQAKQKGIRLNLTPISEEVSEGCWMNIDGDLVERAIINVLTNAIRYSPEGSAVTVDVSERDETHVACRISDQGRGMNAVEVQSLMSGNRISDEQPHQADAAGSMGIGFSMVRVIMQRHGGWIEVSSAVGEGSTITLIFPKIQ
jgi:CHASE2 domain-containing sensor protein/signal transduction histidine kinase